jgi:hypothetical protein
MEKARWWKTVWPLLILAGAIWGGLRAATAPGPGGTGKPPGDILSDLAPEPRTEILVLAAAHLRTLGDAWNLRLVESLNRCLVRFRPHLVAVESMPPYLIEGIQKLGENCAEVARAMAPRVVILGGLGQRELLMARSEAESMGANLLAGLDGMKADEREKARRRLACLLSAACDLPSAVLQWFYLSLESRNGSDGLAPQVHQFLKGRWPARMKPGPPRSKSPAVLASGGSLAWTGTAPRDRLHGL